MEFGKQIMEFISSVWLEKYTFFAGLFLLNNTLIHITQIGDDKKNVFLSSDDKENVYKIEM